MSTIAGCSQRRVAAPCSHLRSRRFSPSSSSHPAAAARRFPSDIRSCPPLRLAPGVATVPFRWTGGGALRAYPYWFCMHRLPSGFTPLFFTHASWQTRNLARASRETPMYASFLTVPLWGSIKADVEKVTRQTRICLLRRVVRQRWRTAVRVCKPLRHRHVGQETPGSRWRTGWQVSRRHCPPRH